jgi:hypothetical protein
VALVFHAQYAETPTASAHIAIAGSSKPLLLLPLLLLLLLLLLPLLLLLLLLLGVAGLLLLLSPLAFSPVGVAAGDSVGSSTDFSPDSTDSKLVGRGLSFRGLAPGARFEGRLRAALLALLLVTGGSVRSTASVAAPATGVALPLVAATAGMIIPVVMAGYEHAASNGAVRDGLTFVSTGTSPCSTPVNNKHSRTPG